MVNHDLQNEAKSREMHGVTLPHKVCYVYKQWYTCDPHNRKVMLKDSQIREKEMGIVSKCQGTYKTYK